MKRKEKLQKQVVKVVKVDKVVFIDFFDDRQLYERWSRKRGGQNHIQ